MKHISILVPDSYTSLGGLSCIAGTYEILSRANSHRKEAGKKALYKIELAGVSDRTDFSEGIFSVKPHRHISTITKTHLIIIPALSGKYEKALNGNKLLTDWIAKQYKAGAEVASMCSGAFMLASTGILNGKICSTHWRFADSFRALFPNVNLQIGKLITDEKGVYTNGGAFSFLNLVIYLVEKYFDRQTAIYCSKVFQIEMDRQSQSAFAIFSGQKVHGDEPIRKAQEYIESRVDEKISIEELSSRFAIGRRNFDRRFIKATGNTPVEYLQRVKIEAAKRAFETTRKTINEVMYEVGYADVKAFREVFRKITGLSPLEYRKKYNNESVGS